MAQMQGKAGDMFKLKVPATSANLGPGFDAVGLAMELWLEVEAEVADAWSIAASGRDVELVGRVRGNLLVETFKELTGGKVALALRVRNGIPLGMGCGSSAAALVAGVLLANHFGGLGMTEAEVLGKACGREGHPDNVAACLLGGFTCSGMREGRVTTATFGFGLPWRLLLVLPGASLATEKARALLPAGYSRADAVENVQATALLVSAFALGRADLLLEGTRDRMHQPFRGEACPLLPRLLPLAGSGGICSVTLSGAGPSVLAIVEDEGAVEGAMARFREVAGFSGVEVLVVGIAGPATFG